MLRCFAVALLLGTAGAATSVWPAPRTMELASPAGAVPLSRARLLVVDAASPKSAVLSAAVARYNRTIAALCRPMAATLSAPSAAAVTVVVTIAAAEDTAPLAQHMNESHSLTATASGVKITAPTVWGALRGLETLAQLVVPAGCAVPLLEIRDAPLYTHRGLLIDSSRHFLPVPDVLELLDSMQMAKLSVLHWHLTDAESFPVECKSFPKLHRLGSYKPPLCADPDHMEAPGGGDLPMKGGKNLTRCWYSQEELRLVVKAAKGRGIRVIPEFDTPAHSASWGRAYPSIRLLCDEGCPVTDKNCMSLLDPSSPLTWKVLNGFFGEMADIFEDERIHLGGDEAHWDCYNKTARGRAWLKKNNWPANNAGFKAAIEDYIYRITDVVKKLGKKPIFWQEVSDKYGLEVYPPYTPPPPKLDPDTALHVWWSPEWYGAARDGGDCADGRCAMCQNVSGFTSTGFGALVSGGWYLGAPRMGKNGTWEDVQWAGMYKHQPSSNLTCNYTKLAPTEQITMNTYGNTIEKPWPSANGPSGYAHRGSSKSGPPMLTAPQQPGQHAGWHRTCQCSEEGPPGNVSHRNVPLPGGCYDIDMESGSAQSKLMLGGEACLWGEHANGTNLMPAVWPATLAVAERLWSRREINSVAQAYPRLVAMAASMRARGVQGVGAVVMPPAGGEWAAERMASAARDRAGLRLRQPQKVHDGL